VNPFSGKPESAYINLSPFDLVEGDKSFPFNLSMVKIKNQKRTMKYPDKENLTDESLTLYRV
jgi:hypothetical protein